MVCFVFFLWLCCDGRNFEFELTLVFKGTSVGSLVELTALSSAELAELFKNVNGLSSSNVNEAGFFFNGQRVVVE